MSVGIENTLKTIAGLRELALDAMSIAKGGISLSDLPKLVQCLQDLRVMAQAGPGALPELKDIDAAEAGQLTSAVYEMVVAIIAEVPSIRA